MTFNTKPNIIVLLVDQLRNDKRHLHPIFNTLQKMGALFSQMITYAPYTLASMHAVFTGMYGNKNAKDCYTLPQYLKENGYYTCIDTFSEILLPSQGVDDFNLYDENTVKNIYRRHTLLLDKTVMKDEPFFLFLHYPKIHKEIVENVIQKYDDFDKNYFGNEKENHARYDKLVIEAGYYLERMIDYIGKLRLFDNSIVVVMTDHGSSLGEVPGELAYGVYTYDYSIKTWCYILSNNLNNNVNVGKAVRNVDILPTLLDLLKIKPKYDMDGESLLPLHKIQDRTAFVETAALIGPHPSPEKPNIKCIRTNEWKLIFNLTTEKKELYNLLKDPNEHNNLIGKHDEIEQDLMEQLSEYL